MAFSYGNRVVRYIKYDSLLSIYTDIVAEIMCSKSLQAVQVNDIGL